MNSLKFVVNFTFAAQLNLFAKFSVKIFDQYLDFIKSALEKVS